MIPREAGLIDTEDEEEECLETLDIAERNYDEVFDEGAKANQTIFRNGA